MSFWLKRVLLLFLLLTPGLAVGYVYFNPRLSSHDWVYASGGQWRDGGLHTAPGPVAGAGLPILVIAGAAYWLARRRKRKPK